MPRARTISEMRLVNRSTGDPALYIDHPGKNNALLFDAGELSGLEMKQLADLEAVFITHHHMDHFVGFDRIVRASMDADKTLHVFGPVGTIQRVYQRITSYEIQFFPFQKIVFQVREIDGDCLRVASLCCADRFPEPEIKEIAWKAPVIYETADLLVEAAAVDHTAPCLAFALVEKTGYHPDPDKLRGGMLRPGPWVEEVQKLLREGASPDTILVVQGGRFPLGLLGEQYFSEYESDRVAYVTDTLWSRKVQSRLVKLASGARRLYCDSYYALAQLAQARTHRHMTASHAAELARRAQVDELILMHFAPRYAGEYQALVDEARAIFPNVSADFG